MTSRKVKDRDSDDEELEVATPTKQQLEEQQLAAAPMMPDHEISPAAYIFQHQEEHDDLNLYEEK